MARRRLKKWISRPFRIGKIYASGRSRRKDADYRRGLRDLFRRRKEFDEEIKRTIRREDGD